MADQDRLSDPNLELITTLLYSVGLPQPPPSSSLAQAAPPVSHCYLLQYGVDRLLAAAADFGWPQLAPLNQSNGNISLAIQIEAHVVETHGDAALDPFNRFIVRIAYKRDGVLRLMSAPRPTLPGVPYYPLSLSAPDTEPSSSEAEVPLIPVHLDPGHVRSSLFTKHKTSYRGEYNEARARVGFDDSVAFAKGEMLLQNERGEIMGGGVTTVYFWREGRWRTPAKETGCKLGVSRRWALENAGVVEGTVMAGDVEEGEMVWLSSAVGGFRRGKVTLKRYEARE